jgi:hypothetical protein
LNRDPVPYFRALLFAFGAAVAVLVGLFFVSGERKYLLWAGRLFSFGLGVGVLFFSILLLQRFI